MRLPGRQARGHLPTMPDRRYDDEETAAIFRLAAEEEAAPPRALARQDGRTLAELQSIGREVGLAPEAIAQAARGLDLRGPGESHTRFGLPIGVGRTVSLPRRLSDEEWDLLVVRLREVFQASGRVQVEGSLRQWSNGNLRVMLEPAGSGQRLRFSTVNGAARELMRGGLATLGIAGVVAAALAAAGRLPDALPGIAVLTSLGLALFGSGALRLPRWASLRRRQMEALAEYAASLPSLSAGPGPRDDG